MSREILFALLTLLCMAIGIFVGTKSVRYEEGPATAPRRRAQAFIGAGLFLPSYLGLWLWLNETVPGWPDAYGTSCRGRGCTIDYMIASPGLLSGGWRELGLFLFLWSMPSFVAIVLGYLFVAKKGIFKKFSAE